MRRTLALPMLLLGSSALAAPTVGPEIQVAPPRSGFPSIATDGTNFLVVFEAHGATSAAHDETIEAVRVDATGKLLDATPITIVSETLQAQQTVAPSPVVGYDPGSQTWLVAWSDGRNASFFSNESDDLYAARLSHDGQVLDKGGLPLAMLPGPQTAESVTFGGGEFLVTFQSLDNIATDNDIRASRVLPNGQVLDGTTGFGVSTAPMFQGESQSAFDGTNFLVVWLDQRQGTSVFGTLVTPGAEVKSPSGFAIENNNTLIDAPSVAFGGGEYFVLWQEKRALDFDIYGARLTAAGSGLDGAPLQIVAAAADQGHPSISYDGTNFLAAWDDSRNLKSPFLDGPDVYGTWIGGSGAVATEGGLELAHTSGINNLHNRSAFDASGQGLLVYQRTLIVSPFTPNVGAELVANGAQAVGGNNNNNNTPMSGGSKSGCAISGRARPGAMSALLLLLLVGLRRRR